MLLRIKMDKPTLSNVTTNSAASPRSHGSPSVENLFDGMASDFVTAKPSRKSARLSSALLDYKRPEGLNMVTLGSSWAVDIFARPHNGLRRELIDLYNMIDSMQRRIKDLRTTDLMSFFEWWDLFASYLQTTIQIADELLIPWAVGGSAMPKALKDEIRSSCKQSTKTLLECFDTVFKQLHRRPPDESLAKIIKGLVHIHPIFAFVRAVEDSLPEIVESTYSEKDALSMERMIALYYHRNGDISLRRFHLAIMARGMTDEVVSAWKRCVPPLVRVVSRALKQRFATEHLGVVEKLALVD